MIVPSESRTRDSISSSTATRRVLRTVHLDAIMSNDTNAPADFDQRLRQREHPLSTIPQRTTVPHGNIPNTPVVVSTISFVLGCIFSLGFVTFLAGGLNCYWWTTYQLGFFVAAWSAFHWAEFAVTAGWNLEKCSVDCKPHHHNRCVRVQRDDIAFLLDNGALYHIANGTALIEYLISLHFKPSLKMHSHVSIIGSTAQPRFKPTQLT
jgi:protein-S-isoprenylcysteine O-methyltransferase